MDKAIIGLIGVALGFFLTVAKELWLQSRNKKKDVEYLSIQVACMLERYIVGCANVVSDDGLYHGEYGSDGRACIQVPLPKFEPESLNVEWKVLPADLMYEVLNFSNHIETANFRIECAFEYSTCPPGFEEGFEERQYQYVQLGIKASKLAAKLRSHANLPEKEIGDWDPIKHMEEEQLTIESLRKMRLENFKKMTPVTEES